MSTPAVAAATPNPAAEATATMGSAATVDALASVDDAEFASIGDELLGQLRAVSPSLSSATRVIAA